MSNYDYYISKLVCTLFSGPYSRARTTETKSFVVAKLLRDLSPNFLNLYGKQKFKTFF